MRMDPLPAITPEALVAALRQRFEELCAALADAVNHAPTGPIISHSEEPVRDLLADCRLEVYQAALQLQIDAAQAAFSPDGRRLRATPPP
jgi:hypothetical protein